MGATKERRAQLKAEKHVRWLLNYTLDNKYLHYQKYYKNNKWSIAHFESWAVQGKAGSCPCGCGWYDSTLINSRARTRKGGKENSCKDVSIHFCSDCRNKIEDIIGHKFKMSYCP